jgi:adenylylsulfate reductase subunit A
MTRKTHYEDCDVLVVGGGMAGTGAAFEARYWGKDMKIIVAEKANIDRSGAVAQGLYAINCYMACNGVKMLLKTMLDMQEMT